MAAASRLNLRELLGMADLLDAAHARALDLTPLMDQIGMAAETTTHERFENEITPEGDSWQPSVRVLEKGGKTLTDSGRLDNSITHLASRDSVEIGSNLIYAGVHQGGATISGAFGREGSVTIPARPFLGIGGDDEQTFSELAADYLLEGLAA